MLGSQASFEKKNYTGQGQNVDQICKVKSKPLLAFGFFLRGIDKQRGHSLCTQCFGNAATIFKIKDAF